MTEKHQIQSQRRCERAKNEPNAADSKSVPVTTAITRTHEPKVDYPAERPWPRFIGVLHFRRAYGVEKRLPHSHTSELSADTVAGIKGSSDNRSQGNICFDRSAHTHMTREAQPHLMAQKSERNKTASILLATLWPRRWLMKARIGIEEGSSVMYRGAGAYQATVVA